MNIKNGLKNIYLGIEKAWKLPKLPLTVSKFYYHTIFRVLRVIGGICSLLMLSKISSQFPLEVKMITDFLGLIHIIKIGVIIIIKMIYVF